ncbi:MAG: TIGR00341 family protein [Haloferacaceae archaeon]|nr:TIGR00341 family protein [Haloferacaceae archaeon]
MRALQIAVPTAEVDAVRAVLDELSLPYTVAAPVDDGDAALCLTAVPTGQLEAALEQLRAAGIDEQTLTVVSEPVSVISAQAEAAEEAVAAEAETDPEQVAREELVAATTDLLRAPRTFVALTAISAIVAVAGVITDAAAVVVGSMVIAPLVGPAMATSVGTVLGDSRLFRRGLARGVGGLVVAVLAATAVAVAIRALGLGPAAVELTAIGQVSVRTRPDLLTLAVALGSGAAGAISLSGAVAATLVGVMIAAALVPPIAVVGIGLAYTEATLVVGAATVLAANIVAINLTALLTLAAQGYRPVRWSAIADARRQTIVQTGVLVVAVLAIGGVLTGATLATQAAAGADAAVTEAITETVADTPGVELEGVQIERRAGLLDRPVVAVTVDVAVAGDPPPGLAAALETRVRAELGRTVPVRVRGVLLL